MGRTGICLYDGIFHLQGQQQGFPFLDKMVERPLELSETIPQFLHLHRIYTFTKHFRILYSFNLIDNYPSSRGGEIFMSRHSQYMESWDWKLHCLIHLCAFLCVQGPKTMTGSNSADLLLLQITLGLFCL